MIIKAGIEYAEVLSKVGTQSFIDSHKDSAPDDQIHIYVKEKYNISAISKELCDPANIYHIIKHENRIAGFSKMMLNSTQPGVAAEDTSKMDQIYLLNSFHGLKLGAQLLNYNIEYSKSSNQKGMWLIVWVGNDKAITFYEKFGFNVVGEGEFHLTDRHTSPCHVMLLDYANNHNLERQTF